MNNDTLLCDMIPANCSPGFGWNDNTSSCVETTCLPGFEWSNNTLTCQQIRPPNYDTYGPVYEPTTSTVIVQAAAGTGASLGFLSALLSGTSAQDSWNIIHIMQLILTLPLIARFIKKAKEFIVSNAFSALSIYFVPIKVIESTPLIRDLSFNQPDKYLSSLGISSGSTLVNNLVLILMLFALGILHLLFCLLHL